MKQRLQVNSENWVRLVILWGLILGPISTPIAVVSAETDESLWLSRIEAAVARFHDGRYHEALKQYEAALRIAGRDEHKGRTLRGIGACWLGLSEYETALHQFDLARPYVVASGNREELAALDSNVATVYLFQDDLRQATRLYRRALAALGANRQSPHRITILSNLALIELRQGRFRPALASLDAALAEARAAGNRPMEATLLDQVGHAQLNLGDYAATRNAFARSLQIRQELGTGVSTSLMFLGLAELRAGRPTAALETLDRSVSLAEQRESRTELWKALYFRGRARWALGQPEPALSDLRRATGLIESIQPKLLPADNLRVQFEVTHHEVYATLADALCELGRSDNAFYTVEQGRAQSLRALLGDRGVVSPVIDIAEAQRELLDSDTLLLNYYIGGRGAWVWAITQSEARLYALPDPSRWRPLASQFTRAVESHSPKAGGLGRQLAGVLLDPIDPGLRERRHWIIAADAELLALPFAALPGGRGRYLIEDHAISYTPSFSVLAALQEQAPERFDHEFLGVADPVVNRADPRWRNPPRAAGPELRLARLVASDSEVRACARLFGPEHAELLTGFEASGAALERRGRDSYRYWHLTSHILTDATRPERSFIVLSAPPEGGAAGRLAVPDILRLRARAEMVVLNGCDSGTGRNLPGAGVVGLARAFLVAGAASVCATRWKVPDDGGELIQTLYRRLIGGTAIDRAEALRRAQVTMIRAGGWRSEPRYWAAYFLIGSRGQPRGETLRARRDAGRP